MHRSVKKITEGAMMVAIYGLILLLNRQLAGLIEFYVPFILPIPLIVYGAKYGLRNSFVVCTSVVFLTLMLALPQTYFYIITAITTGLVYGAMVHRKAKNGMLVLTTILFAIFSNVITTLLFASVFGYDLNADFQMVTNLANQIAGNNLVNMNLSNFALTVVVFSTILTGIFEGVLVHMFSTILLKHLKIPMHPFKPMLFWITPKWTGYLTFIGFSSGILLNYVKMNETLQQVVMIIMIVSNIYLLMFGFLASVLVGVVKYKRNFTLLIVLISIWFWQIMNFVLCVIGFLYITTNMRELLLIRRKTDA